MAETTGIRHCAFCLKELAGKDVKICGGCHRRAYCSKACQSQDWKPSGGGQGHKNWCSLKCGEEDLDWYVADVPGKGLGLIAKRKIPSLFRILVEGPRNVDFPAVHDLMPHGGSLQDKRKLNQLSNGDGTSSLCLRISRANHDCGGNANHFWDPTYHVKILFSEREIQEGEEICFSYTSQGDISEGGGMSREQARAILRLQWGIVCPSTCVCHDEAVEELKKECSELDKDIVSAAKMKKVERALACAKRLLKYEEQYGYSWITKQRTYYDAFQVAIMKGKTVKEGLEYMRKSCDIEESILHPASEACRLHKGYVQKPSSHRNYLICE
jgi:hypothetical protein